MAASKGSVLASANAAVRFLLELVAVVAFGYWGYSLGGTVFEAVATGIGVALVVVLIWGAFGAPAAPYRLDQPWRLILEILILGGATIALYLLGRPLLATGFGAVTALNTVLLYVLEPS